MKVLSTEQLVTFTYQPLSFAPRIAVRQAAQKAVDCL